MWIVCVFKKIVGGGAGLLNLPCIEGAGEGHMLFGLKILKIPQAMNKKNFFSLIS